LDRLSASPRQSSRALGSPITPHVPR